MNRVLILGPGGSGKSTLATRLGKLTGLPVIELDKIFWREGLTPTPRAEWIKAQQELIERPGWILDGDLGPYDAAEARLAAADTILFLDFSLRVCLWRAVRRSMERLDFWLWLINYRRKNRPFLLKAIAKHAPHAQLILLHNPRAAEEFLQTVTNPG